jgi:hypothetical protein
MHTNVILDVKNAYMIRYIQFMSVYRLFRCNSCKRQQTVKDFKSYTFGSEWAAVSHPSIKNVLVGVITKKANDSLFATS